MADFFTFENKGESGYNEQNKLFHIAGDLKNH